MPWAPSTNHNMTLADGGTPYEESTQSEYYVGNSLGAIEDMHC